MHSEQDTNTISDTPSIDKQEQSNRNEPRISENRNITHANNTEQTQTQEQKINLENLERIRLEPWPQCSKNQLQSSNKNY